MKIQLENKNGFLSASSLKIMACIFMFIDHVGLEIFTQINILRVIGRLAYPIFAFFIAEGCKYTKNKTKRFVTMFLLGVLCEIIYIAYNGHYYGNILITFSLSVLLIHSLQKITDSLTDFIKFAVILVAVYIICTQIGVDYGFSGVIAPVFAIIPDLKGKKTSFFVRLGLFAVGLIFVVLENSMNGIQMWSLLAIPLLALYNGNAGNRKLKYGFYLFYPLHLVVIYFVSEIMNYWRA